MPEVISQYDPREWRQGDWLVAIQKLVDHYNSWGYSPTHEYKYTEPETRHFISDLMELVFASRRAAKTPSVGRDARKLIKWLRDVEVGVYREKQK